MCARHGPCFPICSHYLSRGNVTADDISACDNNKESRNMGDHSGTITMRRPDREPGTHNYSIKNNTSRISSTSCAHIARLLNRCMKTCFYCSRFSFGSSSWAKTGFVLSCCPWCLQPLAVVVIVVVSAGGGVGCLFSHIYDRG